MNYPNIQISTIDCNCPDIVYEVTIRLDEKTSTVTEVKGESLLPLLGRSIEVLNVHRASTRRLA